MLTKQVYIVVLQKWKIFIILLWFLLLLLLLLPEMTEHIWVYVVVLFMFLLPIFTYAKSWFDFISQRTDRTRNDWRGDWSLCIDFREWTRRFIQSWGFCIFFFLHKLRMNKVRVFFSVRVKCWGVIKITLSYTTISHVINRGIIIVLYINYNYAFPVLLLLHELHVQLCDKMSVNEVTSERGDPSPLSSLLSSVWLWSWSSASDTSNMLPLMKFRIIYDFFFIFREGQIGRGNKWVCYSGVCATGRYFWGNFESST